MEKLKKEGAFREKLEKTAFERSFQVKFGEKKEVSKVERGQVVDSEGKRYAVQEVQAVPKAGADKPMPRYKGRELTDTRLRDKLQPFAKELFDALPDEEITTQAAAQLLREEFNATKPKTMNFATFLRLFPRLFAVNGNKVKRKVVPVGVRMEASCARVPQAQRPQTQVREVPVAAPKAAPKAARAPANLRTRSQYRAAGVRL